MARYDSITDVAHAWANQSSPEGRAGGALTFAGLSLYSYRLEIARLYPDRMDCNGHPVCLILTSSGRSVTTAGHIGQGHRAVRRDHHTITVEDVSPHDHSDHLTNCGFLASEIVDLCAKQHRARKYDYREDIKRWLDSLRAYVDAFNVDLSSASGDLRAHRAALLIAQLSDDADPEDVMEIALDWDKRDRERNREQMKRYREERRRKVEELKQRQGENLAAWRCYQTLPHLREGLPGNHQYLRVITFPDGSRAVETSLNVTVREKRAAQLWGALKRGEIPDQPQIGRLGRIERITDDGGVVAGCHYIPREELDYAARELGLETR